MSLIVQPASAVSPGSLTPLPLISSNFIPLIRADPVADRDLFQTLFPSVPAKIFVPETARQMTSELVKPVGVQLVPLLVERKTPPKVPAKIFVPDTASDLT